MKTKRNLGVLALILGSISVNAGADQTVRKKTEFDPKRRWRRRHRPTTFVR